MRILVTGATGLLGRSLVRILSPNHVVYALGRQVAAEEPGRNVIPVRADLSRFDPLLLPASIDAVYYLAQSRRFREFPEGMEDMVEVNIRSPLRIAEWARRTGVTKFFYASTGGVYKNPTQPVSEFLDISANEKNGFYLDSKLCSEMLLRNYALYFATFAILRPFFIYGPEQHEDMLIPRLIKSVLTGKEIFLNGPDGIRINPVYVDDAAKAFERLLYIETGEYVFNIAGTDIVSIKQLSALIGDIVGVEPVFRYVQGKSFDLIADVSLMKEKLHEPEILLAEGIGRVVGAK